MTEGQKNCASMVHFHYALVPVSEYVFISMGLFQAIIVKVKVFRLFSNPATLSGDLHLS